MKIEVILNNNLVQSRNKEGKEIILRGKGIGFGKKKGDEVKSEQVERIFVPNDKNEMARFSEFFSKLPQEYWEAAEQILAYAKDEWDICVPANVILPICDHISGAVERYKSGNSLKNPMLWDVKRLYPKEFQIGKYALEVIKRRFHAEMKEDEAAFLAFHFIYAQLNCESSEDVLEITRLICDISNIVEACYQIKLDENSWDYQRFVTHIKFFAQRMLSRGHREDSDDEWFQMIKNQFPRAYRCIVKIADFIHDTYYYEMNREEMLYLTIHIEKVTRNYTGSHF